MIATQHTEATRKKLREAGFFLRLLATVDKATVMTPEPEAPDFYLSVVFFSRTRRTVDSQKGENRRVECVEPPVVYCPHRRREGELPIPHRPAEQHPQGRRTGNHHHGSRCIAHGLYARG